MVFTEGGYPPVINTLFTHFSNFFYNGLSFFFRTYIPWHVIGCNRPHIILIPDFLDNSNYFTIFYENIGRVSTYNPSKGVLNGSYIVVTIEWMLVTNVRFCNIELPSML